MKRQISRTDLERFIKAHYASKMAFSKALQVSYAHLNSMLKQRVNLGEKVYRRLKALCLKHHTDIEELLEPLPMMIQGEPVKEIIVVQDQEVIASITSRDIVAKKGFEVVCVPSEIY